MADTRRGVERKGEDLGEGRQYLSGNPPVATDEEADFFDFLSALIFSFVPSLSKSKLRKIVARREVREGSEACGS